MGSRTSGREPVPKQTVSIYVDFSFMFICQSCYVPFQP